MNYLRLLRTSVGISNLITFETVILSLFSYDTLNNEAFVKDTTAFLLEYDFIVVGAGSAGAVVASRLFEMSSWKVLLLEAGENESNLMEIPAIFAYFVASDADWRGEMLPAEDARYCQAMKNKRCSLARGKILGGTSSINAMVYVRANKHDFDNWASMGNPGWEYETVLPYFRKSEDNGNSEYLSNMYHGSEGPLTVQETPYRTVFADFFIESGKDMGYAAHDVNGTNQIGFMISQATLRNGRRLSTARAFLRPTSDKNNLYVSMNSHVTKILIDPKMKQAYGVEFMKGQRKYVIGIRKEVVLSAEVIGSPHLLMMSDVGNIKEHLDDHQNPVIQDLKVDDNLQDHYGLGGMTFTIDAPISTIPDRIFNLPYVLQYFAKQRGQIAGITGECVVFLNTKYANKFEDWPPSSSTTRRAF